MRYIALLYNPTINQYYSLSIITNTITALLDPIITTVIPILIIIHHLLLIINQY